MDTKAIISLALFLGTLSGLTDSYSRLVLEADLATGSTYL